MNLTDRIGDCLPEDGGTLIGRAWIPGEIAGPGVIVIRDGLVYELTSTCPTTSFSLNQPEPLKLLDDLESLEPLDSLDSILHNSIWNQRKPEKPYLLPPCDLQAVKACGVTFVVSLIERVIEERAGGDPKKAESIRSLLSNQIGKDLYKIKPGSNEAMELKQLLIDRRMWSAYLEVAIGPDAEVFTKGQPLASVGHGMDIGIHPMSKWNNPEPEIVLAINREGKAVGATLGNDVNLRDVEGRSTLLLGKAKDNNGSCSIGPFIRLFDDFFDLEIIRNSTVRLNVSGQDGYYLEAESEMSLISRDPQELVEQTINVHHQYPDGLMLFLGTMFVPTDDRGQPGSGFTHKPGDIVEIYTPNLGCLVNRVDYTHKIPPWNFGVYELMENLGKRGHI